MFCTYLHINETGVFYAGCGSKGRARVFRGRPAQWKQVASSGYSVWIVEEFKNKQDAWELEKELIAYFKPACNKAKGGPGSTGCTHTLEAREKISVSQRGEKNHNYGKRLSFETREKMSGEKQPHHKLTKEQVLAIRLDTRVLRLISIDYGISLVHVSQIKLLKRWKHI